ncbi:BNR-repeat neuraminidase N-terminal domain-containing protein [Chitinophaga sp. GCM10012297]|uniref:Sialidase N-terminal domain-containing protein n=1 Tax=Chitinophaga chungangae TaxID=2821488 RepID=A0ABS3YAB2_9BACT|nr:sialidase family protein [Chitinophaga chungangae]MBO9151609.1 hypothetical protein [Chitinophaga chungangae]
MQRSLKVIISSALCCLLPAVLTAQEAVQRKFKVPVLTGKEVNPVIRIRVDAATDGDTLRQVEIMLKDAASLANVRIYSTGADTALLKTGKTLFAGTENPATGKVRLQGVAALQRGANYFWVTVSPSPSVPLSARLDINAASLKVNDTTIGIAPDVYRHRFGVALRQHGQDDVHTHRIPGLATAKDGTLLAIYDARRESGRDLQGNIDIGLSRSFDKGKTWRPMQIVMDMGA